MSQQSSGQKPARGFRLSEDWLAVIIGLILVVLVRLGAIGRVPWPLFGFWK